MKMKARTTTPARWAPVAALLLLLALALLALPARADGDESPYGLYVGGVAITRSGQSVAGTGGGTATFTVTEDAYTLTLDSYVFQGEGYAFYNTRAALYYDGNQPLSIVLKGENRLTQQGKIQDILYESYGIRSCQVSVPVTIRSEPGGTLYAVAGDASTSTGIECCGPLTVDGTVEAVGRNADNASNGVDCWGPLTVSGTLTATGGTASGRDYSSSYGIHAINSGITVLPGGTVSAKAQAAPYSFGVYCNGLSVTDATLTAQSPVQGEKSTALYISSSGSLSADGLTILAGESEASSTTVTGDGWKNQKYVQIFKQYPLWIGGQEVTSAHLEYTGDTGAAYGTGKWSYDPSVYTLTLDAYSYTGAGKGITDNSLAALYYKGSQPLTIVLKGENRLTQQGKIQATLKESYGIRSSESNVPVTIRSEPGGTLYAVAGDASTSTGIECKGPMTVDGTVEAVGGQATLSSYGVMCFGTSLTVEGGRLTATGGQAGYNSYGIFVSDGLTVKPGAVVAATGGAAPNSLGIYSQKAVSVDRASVTAIATAGENIKARAIFLEENGAFSPSGVAVLAGADETAAEDVTGKKFSTYENSVYIRTYPSYPLWVGGQQVTSENLKYEGTQGDAYGAGKWSYDPDAYTLTLDAYTYTGEGYYFTDYDADYKRDVACAAALFYDGDAPLTIELVGENRLTQTPSTSRPLDESYGLLSRYEEEDGETALTIRNRGNDKGSLTLAAGQAKNYSQGVYAYYGSLDVDGVTLYVRADEADASYGLETDDLTITNSAVYATAGDALTYSYGVECWNITVNSATLTAEAGKATGEDGSSVGIACDGLTVTAEAFVTATGRAAEVFSAGVECYGDLTVDEKGRMAAFANPRPDAGDPTPALSVGIWCIGEVRIEDAFAFSTPFTIVFSGSGPATISYAVECNYLIVNDASLTGFVINDTGNSVGIDCETANIVGTKTLVIGKNFSGQGVGISVKEKFSGLDKLLGIYLTEDAPIAVGESGYYAALEEYDKPMPYVRIAPKYDVTLNANGGRIDGAETKTVGVVPETYAYIAARDTAPARSGWSFDGWALSADGAAIEETYRITGDTTLYARWKQNASPVYTGGETRSTAPKAAPTAHGKVTFDPANPKSGDTVTVTVTPDEGYALAGITAKDADGKDVPLTKTGDGAYTFTQGSSQVTVTAEFAEKPESDPLSAFTDLDPEAWYADDVRWALSEGVMNGMGGGVFAPDGTVSRAMVVQVLWKRAGAPVVDYAMNFPDVDGSAWYAEAVRWAASVGIASGYEDGTFGSEDPVTRQELAVLLYRCVRSEGRGFTGTWYFPLTFDDAAEIADWADEAMHWMVMNGVLNGRGEDLLAPGGDARRAELAAVLHRLSGLLAA